MNINEIPDVFCNTLRIKIIVGLVGVILSACENTDAVAMNEAEKGDLRQKEIIENGGTGLPLTPVSEASDKEVVVYYAGEKFTKSVFAVGGDKIFIYGIKSDGKYFLGYMNMEEDVFREIPVNCAENMHTGTE